jgi:ATP-dependent RNA helicase RhlE
MPKEIGALAAEMLRDPLRVQVTPIAKTADRVRQSVIHVEQQKKNSLLVELFKDPTLTRTLVFTRTKRGADKVARHLEDAGILVAAIHGNKSQSQRERALDLFRKGQIRGLIATDIAARGIDIDDVSHVINFELPNIPESYVHRIGRTARAGAEGTAISLCSGDERAYLRDIERTTRQTIPASDRTGDAGLVSSGGAGGDRGHRHHGGGGRPQRSGNGSNGHKPGQRGGGGGRGHEAHGKRDGAGGGQQRDRWDDARGPKRGGNGGQQHRAGGGGRNANRSSGNGGGGFSGLPRSIGNR